MLNKEIRKTESISTKVIFIYFISSLISLFIFNLFTINTTISIINIKQYYLYFIVIFIILTSIILLNILRKNKIFLQERLDEYKNFDDIQKSHFALYEFALDKSVDAIHWLTMDGKFVYANDSTCRMDGYTKKEFESLYLEDVDPNFTRKTAPLCMLDMKNTPNWRIESTHKRKDGTIYPIEVSGHCITYKGEEYICAFARDTTERVNKRKQITSINKQLQESLSEKEILLKEIHHRVKNNMEIISSLLNMQVRRTNNEEIKHALLESMSRIQTMALVHEFLYLGKSLAKIDFHTYISRLLNDIKELYITQNTKLNIDLNVDKLHLSTDRCIQLGMVLHEICVNSMKYAFHENKDNLLCIHIKLNKNLVKIKIRDNGEGIKDINSFHKSNSIGMQLIRTIVENQLDGKLHFLNNNGLECNIEFLKEESHYE